ncbi:MAG: hypothetical protein M3Q13_01215 [Pseudomonadota bacterium]|nr:hypothetical protein [Pseudomonadota bacterium]
MQLREQHQRSVCDGGAPLTETSTGSCSEMHCPFAQVQVLISLKPQTDAIPLRAHSARTAAGSVRLFRLTQAGIAPQQLPTSLTTQSALVRQVWLMTGGWLVEAGAGITSGGSGSLIGGAGLVRTGADVPVVETGVEVPVVGTGVEVPVVGADGDALVLGTDAEVVVVGTASPCEGATGGASGAWDCVWVDVEVEVEAVHAASASSRKTANRPCVRDLIDVMRVFLRGKNLVGDAGFEFFISNDLNQSSP